MTLVVDASVAIKWFIQEDGQSDALALLDVGERLVAPDFIKIELANIGWKKARLGQADFGQIAAMLAQIDGFFEAFESAVMLLPDAYRIASELDHPVYDCIYLACARSASSKLITADRRLTGKCDVPAWRETLVFLSGASGAGASN